MNIISHTVPQLTFLTASAAVLIAFVFILLMSIVREPERQKLNALLIAGAGAVYWSGGLGLWEFLFGSITIFVAFKGLTNYKYIALGWILHTGWDIMHHLYGNPIVYLEPTSSAGCAICDPILAIWFFFGAPSIFDYLKKRKLITR